VRERNKCVNYHRILYNLYQMANDVPGEESAIIGYVQGGQIYAPANFSDGLNVSINNSLVSTVNNVSLYHITGATDKSQQQQKQLRKRMRDIVQSHQEKILKFLTIPLPEDHTMKTARALLTKYGRGSGIIYDIHRPPPQFFKDYIADLSGSAMSDIQTFIESLEKSRVADTPLQRQYNMTKGLIDYMKLTGDEFIRLEQKLQSECLQLDSVVEKVAQMASLDLPELEGFAEMMERLIQKHFEKHPIEKLYRDYVSTVEKYLALRDLLTIQRASSSGEPVCCVCMTENVSMGMIPCGHTFCGNCAKWTTTCAICRITIQSRIKLYFS